jgi:hypothetical protein
VYNAPYDWDFNRKTSNNLTANGQSPLWRR